MRVVFTCYIYDFHKKYCNNIADEIKKRGGDVVFAEDGAVYRDVDFTIQPDQAYPRFGGKGIFINHAMPVWPQNDFWTGQPFKHEIKANSDYIFTYSNAWTRWNEDEYEIPTHVVGYPRLDKLFGNLEKDGTVLFAPTHHFKRELYSGDRFSIDDMRKHCLDLGYSDFIYRQHPAFCRNELSLEESYKKASVVISDYSSVGLEAITLNIPTIMIGHPRWINRNSDHISNRAEGAATRVYYLDGLKDALDIYKMHPKYLEHKRVEYSEMLCEHQGCAAKRAVDVMEGLL
jgi:hypothetical protein